MNAIEVGKPFPIKINPDKDFCVMELWGSGPTVIINFNDLTAKERRMFKESFNRYAYYEPEGTDAPIALWVFGFSKPFGVIEVNFNSKIVEKRIVDDYLEKENGQTKNLWQFILLDRGIVQAIKAIGLHPEAVDLFQETIRKQLASAYTNENYDMAMRLLSFSSSDEIMDLGTVFDLRRKNG